MTKKYVLMEGENDAIVIDKSTMEENVRQRVSGGVNPSDITVYELGEKVEVKVSVSIGGTSTKKSSKKSTKDDGEYF